MRSKVVVTGATSFIGTRLVKKLIRADFDVYAVIRKGSSNKNKLVSCKGVNIFELNMDEIDQLPEKITNCDVFFHLAWDGTRGQTRDDATLQQSNYLYSIKALEVAGRLGCKIFLSAGSQAEYGVNDRLVSEDTTCYPKTEYGKAKLNFFIDASSYCKLNKISFKEPRFFSLYGPNDFEGTLIISTIKKMLNNEPVELTECVQMWNFLYIDDAIDGLLKLITTKCKDGPYNFGSNDTRQLKSFINEIYQITKSHSKLLFGVLPYHNLGMVSIQPDNSKLKNETGWLPKTSFADGILKVINVIKQGENN